ncbi:MAG TPA: hypothetical protein VFG20_15610 [Planctomycetaceae bacterium]|nr:hypothetical protein [Planctomycetaceae bacterium]
MSAPHTAALRQLASQLDDYAQEHPHLKPFTVLTEAKDENRVLSRDAAAIWDEIAKSRPNDPLAWHHLAVIHHGRAYQSYNDIVKTHAQSFGDWSQAFRCWIKLIRHDPFWSHLKEQWEARSQQKGEMLAQRLVKIDLNEFRRQLAPHLVKVHETIIQDTWQKHSAIAREHLKLILTSDLDADLITRTRAGLYLRIAGDVQDQITKFEFAQVRSAIEAYLELDDSYVQALADRLSVTVAERERLGGFAQTTARFRADEKWAEKLKPWTKPGAKIAPMEAFTAAAALRDFYFEHGLVQLAEANANTDTNRVACVKYLIDANTEFGHAYDFERGGQKSVASYENTALYAVLRGIQEEHDITVLTRVSEAYLRRLPTNAGAHAVGAMIAFAKDDVAQCEKALAHAEDLNRKVTSDHGARAISEARQLASQGSPKVARLLKEAGGLIQSNPSRAVELYESALRLMSQPSEAKRDALLNLVTAELFRGRSYWDSARRHLREVERMLIQFPSEELRKIVADYSNLLK